MIRRISRILSTIVTIILALVLAGNIYIIAAKKITGKAQPTFLGWASAVVISGSMEPEIHVNDMVVFRAQTEYSVGDIIVFQNGDSLITHRIVEVLPEGFRTKGDYNNSADPWVVSEQSVVGKVVLVIPAIGAAAEFAQTPLGMLLLLAAGFILLAWPALVGDNPADNDKDEDNVAAQSKQT